MAYVIPTDPILRTGDNAPLLLDPNWDSPAYPVDDLRFTGPEGYKVEIYAANPMTKIDVTEAVVSVDWSDSLEQACVEGTLVLYDPVHPETGNRRMENVKKGQRVKISIINNQNQLEELGRYVIWSKTRNSRNDASLTIEFKDILIYLQKSEDTWLFQKNPKKKAYRKGWTAAQITEYVARRYGIPLATKKVRKTITKTVRGKKRKITRVVSVPDLPNCTHYNPLIRVTGGSVYELLLKVWTEERKMTGRKYVIRIQNDRLRVLHKSEQPVMLSIQEGQNLINSTFTDSLEGMATAVTVMSEPQSNSTTATTQSTDRKTSPTQKTREDTYPASGGGWTKATTSFYPDFGDKVSCPGNGVRTTDQMGFGEASTNYTKPSAPWDWKAMGNLPCGTMIEVRYNGKTIQVPKIDIGRGGPGKNGLPRVMDLTSAAWDALGIPRSQGVVPIEWRLLSGTGTTAASLPGVSATAKNQRKIDQYGYIHKLIKLDKAITKKDAKKEAVEILKTNLKENLDGSVTCHLLPRLRAGEPIFVRDEAARLIGKFYCSNVSHTLSATACTTTVGLNWLDMVPSALLTDEDKGIKASSGSLNNTNCGEAALAAGRKYIGTPYSWGGGGSSGPSYGIARTNGESGTNIKGFDCSGFVQYCWAQAGVSVPRHTDAFASIGVAVPKGQEQPGDILLYNTSDGAGSKYGHMALWSGPGMILNSGGAAGGGVREYARNDHVLVRRVSQLCPSNKPTTGGGGGGGGGTLPSSPTTTTVQTFVLQYNPLLMATYEGSTGPTFNVLSNQIASDKRVAITLNGRNVSVTSRKPIPSLPSGVDIIVGSGVATLLGISTKVMQKFTVTITYL